MKKPISYVPVFMMVILFILLILMIRGAYTRQEESREIDMNCRMNGYDGVTWGDGISPRECYNLTPEQRAARIKQ